MENRIFNLFLGLFLPFFRVWKEWEIVGSQFNSMLMTDGESCVGPLSREVKVSSRTYCLFARISNFWHSLGVLPGPGDRSHLFSQCSCWVILVAGIDRDSIAAT